MLSSYYQIARRLRDLTVSRHVMVGASVSLSSLSTSLSLPSSHRTLAPKPYHLLAAAPPISTSFFPCSLFITTPTWHRLRRRRARDLSVAADDVDVDSVGGNDYDIDADEDEVEELDNKKDYDVEYDHLLGVPIPQADGSSSDDIEMIQSSSFVSTQGTESEKVVDYRINEEEFHKISLLHCDFFIRKPPDPDNNVYDFREMYVTPPDTDVYSIPKVIAAMPQKYIRCSKTDFGCYNVTEPPIDAPRDPLYKTDREILKVFLTKHYRNRRIDDPEFILDFEEIYVIDSKSKSITRAKVIVTLPDGKERDRRKDLLIIRDGGTSFKIIDKSQRDDATTVIEREEWMESRRAMEKHLSKLRDFHISNWF